MQIKQIRHMSWSVGCLVCFGIVYSLFYFKLLFM
uniref:Signal recognition particle subunit srp72, putative n=1 Tax=Arundo donax TaxID=35708 RepID=A0A0A9EC37_ARUDO